MVTEPPCPKCRGYGARLARCITCGYGITTVGNAEEHRANGHRTTAVAVPQLRCRSCGGSGSLIDFARRRLAGHDK